MITCILGIVFELTSAFKNKIDLINIETITYYNEIMR